MIVVLKSGLLYVIFYGYLDPSVVCFFVLWCKNDNGKVCVGISACNKRKDCIVQCTLLYSTVLYCAALHCTALHCTGKLTS